MTPVKQSVLHTSNLPHQRGNCLSAVIASFLDLPIESTIQPQLLFDESSWLETTQHWLNSRSYLYRSANEFSCFHGKKFFFSNYHFPPTFPHDHTTYYKNLKRSLKNQHYLISGTSPRNPSITHICIFLNGELFHDPHPSNSGILSLDHFSIIEKK